MFVRIATYEKSHSTFILIDREARESLGWEEFDKVLVTQYPDQITIKRDVDATRELRSVGQQLRVICPQMFPPHGSIRYDDIKVEDGRLVICINNPVEAIEPIAQAIEPVAQPINPEPEPEHILAEDNEVNSVPLEQMPLPVDKNIEDIVTQFRDSLYGLVHSNQSTAISPVDLFGESTQDDVGRLRGEIIGRDHKGREIRKQKHDDAVKQLNTLSDTWYRNLDKKIAALCGNIPDDANDLCLTPDDIWQGPLEVLGLDQYFIDVANPQEDFGTMEHYQSRDGTRFPLMFSGVRAGLKWGLEKGSMGSIAKDWKGTAIWCNPPFSQSNWATFAEKAAREAIGHRKGARIKGDTASDLENYDGELERHADYVFFLMPGMEGHMGNKWDENVYFKEICFEIMLQHQPKFWMIDTWKTAKKAGLVDKNLFIKGIPGAIRMWVYSSHPDRKQVIKDLITYYEEKKYLYPHKADYYRWLADKTMP
jgi:bifunctional DNA-binding transcriptional regulator/antitoxin component of YhaV-PrlF toxin-antitoxin module